MSSFETHGGVLLGILCLVCGQSLSAVYVIRLCRSPQHDCGSVFWRMCVVSVSSREAISWLVL